MYEFGTSHPFSFNLKAHHGCMWTIINFRHLNEPEKCVCHIRWQSYTENLSNWTSKREPQKLALTQLDWLIFFEDVKEVLFFKLYFFGGHVLCPNLTNWFGEMS